MRNYTETVKTRTFKSLESSKINRFGIKRVLYKEMKKIPDFNSYEEVKRFVESKEFEELSDKDALKILDIQQRLFYKENPEAFEDIPELEEALEIQKYLDALKE